MLIGTKKPFIAATLQDPLSFIDVVIHIICIVLLAVDTPVIIVFALISGCLCLGGAFRLGRQNWLAKEFQCLVNFSAGQALSTLC